MNLNKFLLPSKNEHSKSKKLFFIILFLFFPLTLYAGWETWTQLITPADGDLLAVQDVSDTTGDASGTTKYLTLSGLWNYINAKILSGTPESGDFAVFTDADTVEGLSLTESVAALDTALQSGGFLKSESQTAADVSVATTNFGSNLSSADNTIQKVADTLDDVTLGADQALNTTDDPYFASVGTTMVSHGTISSGTQNISPGFNWITVGGSFTLGLTGFVNGISSSATLVLNHDGNSTVTMPTSVYWEDLDGDGDGDPPVFDSNKNPGRYVLIFMSPSGGITYFGFCTSIYPMAMPE